MTGKGSLDLAGFRQWATGNLVENRTRGIFAEWLTGQALGVIGPDDIRTEWDAADLRYRDRLIEVKASGRGQTWSQERPSVIRFDIANRQQAWDAETDTFEAFDQPGRVADVYVFCLPTPDKATNDNVADPSMWTFWVIATATLDAELGDQKTIGTGRLSTLANPVSWDDLHDAVDQTIS